MSKLKLKITAIPSTAASQQVYIDDTDEAFSIRESFLARRDLKLKIKRYPSHPYLKSWQNQLRQHRRHAIPVPDLKVSLTRQVYGVFEVKVMYNVSAVDMWNTAPKEDPSQARRLSNRYNRRYPFSFDIRRSMLQSIKEEVRRVRAKLNDRSQDTFFNRASGNLLELYKEKLRELAKTPKKPSALDNFVGIEIEFLSPLNEERMLDMIVKHKLSKYVELKYDGSVEDGNFEHSCGAERGAHISDTDCDCDAPYGHELCVLTKEGHELRDVVIKVCRMLDEAKAYVNTTCGLHVHIDARNRSHKAIYKRLVQSLPALRWLVPESRRTNDRYCKLVYDTAFPARDREERYRAINGQSYYDHQTIEVRLHSGTVNAEKIINWVDLLLRIVSHKRDFPWPTDASRVIPSDLYKALKDVPKDLRFYFSERYKKFKKALTDTDASDLNPQVPQEVTPPTPDEVDALVDRASALFNIAPIQRSVQPHSGYRDGQITLRAPNDPPPAPGSFDLSSMYMQMNPVQWVVANVDETPPAPQRVEFTREYNAAAPEGCTCEECQRAREDVARQGE